MKKKKIRNSQKAEKHYTVHIRITIWGRETAKEKNREGKSWFEQEEEEVNNKNFHWILHNMGTKNYHKNISKYLLKKN